MIDPFNDNQRENYERWLKMKQPLVVEYLGVISANLECLDLSPRAYAVLRINGLKDISKVIFFSKRDLMALECSNETIAREIYSNSFYFMKDIRSALVDYVNAIETRKSDCKSCTVTMKEAQDFLIVDTNKEMLMNCLKKQDVPIEQLNVTVRTYNCLKRNHINTLSQAIKLYPEDFFMIKGFGAKSVSEIQRIIEQQACEFLSGLIVFDGESDDVDEKLKDSIPQSGFEALLNPRYRDKVCDYFAAKKMPIEHFGFSNRIYNFLKKANKNQFVDILHLFPDGVRMIDGLGDKSDGEILNVIVDVLSKNEKALIAYINGDNTVLYDDDAITEYIVNRFDDYPVFSGISIGEFIDGFVGELNESRLKNCLKMLISEHKLEYVDGKCYKAYPSFFEVIDSYFSETNDIYVKMLEEHFSGMALDEIAQENGITREGIRQKVWRTRNKVIKYTLLKFRRQVYEEDYYSYLFKHYSISKEDWLNYICSSEKTYYYLKCNYPHKGTRIENAIQDELVTASLKLRVLQIINKDKIEIDGVLIDRSRHAFEDYVIRNYCDDDIELKDFYELCNSILSKNDIPYDTRLYYTEEVKKTRTNRFADSRIVLWKSGMRFRFYDIDSDDYQDLLDKIGIFQLTNTGLSTLYWINEFPGLMRKYDIRDQYELHNLLKKIVPEGGENNIKFDRMPGITFGNFDRDQMIYELMCSNSPVSATHLANILYIEYGYDPNTCMSTYFNCIRQYYYDGVYSTDYKKIPSWRQESFIDSLEQDFYFDYELIEKYTKMFSGADPEEINPRSMQSLGFYAYSKYYLKAKWTSLSEYFRWLLTQKDYFDCSEYSKRYAYIQAYTSTLRDMRSSFEIFTMDDGTAISIDRLSRLDITKESIIKFCNEVYSFVEEDEYFTIKSLRNRGFKSIIDNLGFDDSFCSGILEVCGKFVSTHCVGKLVLVRGSKIKDFTKNDFVVSVINKFESISTDDLLDCFNEEYGIRIKEKYLLQRMISGSDIYYDEIMDKFYKSKENYYSDLF